MTTSLFVFGLLGIVTTALAFYANRRFFASGEFARVSVLEGVFYVVGVASALVSGGTSTSATPIATPIRAM